MNAAETLKAARNAGLTIIAVGEKLTIRGDGDLQSHLVESIRVNKLQVMTLIKDELAKEASKAKEGMRQGSGTTLLELNLPEVMVCLTPKERSYLVDRIMNLGEPAIGWCLARANAYFEKFPESNSEDQDAAAASDFLLWQDGLARGKYPNK